MATYEWICCDVSEIHYSTSSLFLFYNSKPTLWMNQCIDIDGLSTCVKCQWFQRVEKHLQITQFLCQIHKVNTHRANLSTHEHTHACTQTHTDTHTYRHTHIHTHTHTHTHTNTQSYMHTHMCMCKHTHTHTHTCACMRGCVFEWECAMQSVTVTLHVTQGFVILTCAACAISRVACVAGTSNSTWCTRALGIGITHIVDLAIVCVEESNKKIEWNSDSWKSM